MEVNVHEAKTHLSRLLKRVEAGEEITISRAGVPVARLIAAGPVNGQRLLGSMKGQIYMAEDFDAPLPDDILTSFYGEPVRRKRRAVAKPGKAAKRQARR